MLKKFRVDYLLFMNTTKSISFKIVLYVESFDMPDLLQKASINGIPDNINLNEELTRKAQNVVNNYLKVIDYIFNFIFCRKLLEIL